MQNQLSATSLREICSAAFGKWKYQIPKLNVMPMHVEIQRLPIGKLRISCANKDRKDVMKYQRASKGIFIGFPIDHTSFE
tara:strand:- start:228 stop:467 length:240 start_codon:yes stop_codon:yes gene_type:complete